MCGILIGFLVGKLCLIGFLVGKLCIKARLVSRLGLKGLLTGSLIARRLVFCKPAELLVRVERLLRHEISVGSALDDDIIIGREQRLPLKEVVRVFVDEVVELLVAVVVFVVVVSERLRIGQGNRLERGRHILNLAGPRQKAQLLDHMLAMAHALDFFGRRDRLGRSLKSSRGSVGLCSCGLFLAPARDLGHPIAGTDVGKHAKHRRDGRLVVVDAGRARREVLGHGAHAEKQKRQRHHDAHDPSHELDGQRQEHKRLNYDGHEHDTDKHKPEAADERQVARKLRAVKEALVGRVVVRDDNDGAGTLDDRRTRRRVEAHDVLAHGFAPKPTHDGLAGRIHEQKRGGDHCQNGAHDKRPALRKAAQKDAKEEQNLEETPENGACRGAIELLDGHIHAMFPHRFGDGLRSEVFFLAVRRSDGDLVVKIVQKVLGLGHGRVPLFVRVWHVERTRCTYRVKYTPRRIKRDVTKGQLQRHNFHIFSHFSTFPVQAGSLLAARERRAQA